MASGPTAQVSTACGAHVGGASLGQWQGLEECHTVQFLLPDGRLLTKADCDVALSEFCQDKQ